MINKWNDIDSLKSHNDFTYDDKSFTDLPKFIEHLHQIGMKYIPMFDAGISASEKPGTYFPFDEGKAWDIFVKNSSNQLFLGDYTSDGFDIYFPFFCEYFF